MNKEDKTIQFQIDGLFKLKKVGDYLKLVDKKVSLVFKRKNPVLNTKKVSAAYVAALSERGTHLILKNLQVKKFFFFSNHIEKYIVPIDTISSIQILDRYGKID